MLCEQYFYDQVMHDIHYKIYEIKKQQKKVRKYYKKCAHCKKMDMVTMSGCKLKHKLCSECIYDKTECPVCKEDLGLVCCDICYEYKKGCPNGQPIFYFIIRGLLSMNFVFIYFIQEDI